MVPRYVDISHFRAPYKNSVMMGFGQANGNGAPGETQDPRVRKDDRGYLVIKEEMQPTLDQILLHHTVMPIPSDKGIAVQLVRYSSENMVLARSLPDYAKHLEKASALNWTKGQVQAGMVVLAPITTIQALFGVDYSPGAPTPPPYPQGADFLYAVTSGSAEAKEAAKSPLGIVIAGDPDSAVAKTRGALAKMGPVGIAAVAAGTVGLVWWLRS